MYQEIVVIYEEEGSSSTVHHTDIIYDNDVKIEYEDCIQESVRLDYEEKKEENKKENSFNTNESQKSKIKCKEDFFQLTNKRKNSESIQRLHKHKKKKDTKKPDHIEVNNAVNGELADIMKKKSLIPAALSKKKKDVSHIEVNNAVNRELVDLIKKKNLISPALSKKKKDVSYFDDENNHSTEADQEGSIIILSDTEDSSDKKDNNNVSMMINIDDSSCSSSEGYTKNKMVPRMIFPGLNNKFKGDMFLVKDPTLGIALNKGTRVYYCLKENYILAENAKSATMAGRRLLDGVFTVQALSLCSLSGLPPRGKGKSAYADKPSLIKPYLCSKAVNAIINKVLQFQKINQWFPKKDSSKIKNAMAVRINEIATFPDRRKKRWSEEEKETALCAFSEYMEKLKLPSSKNIELIKKKYISLNKRTWPQIKTWLYKQQQKETLRRQQLY